MSLSSVRSETALRSRLFSSSRSFRRFTCSVFSPPNSWRHRSYVTSLTPIWRIASTMFWPCETKTSTCRNFATISSGLYRFLAITVLLDVKDIPQVGLLQRGRITETGEIAVGGNRGRSRDCSHIFMRPTTKRRERELHDVVAHGAVDVRAIAQSATGQALVAQRIKRGYKYSRALRDVSLHPPPPTQANSLTCTP